MRIAFILPSLENRGPIVFTRYLIEGLKSHVDSIDVYYFKGAVDVDLGVQCHQIGFFEKIDFDRYDIIHTTMARPDLYIWLNRSSVGNKWVISAHNFFKEDVRFLYNPIVSFIFSNAWQLAFNACENIIVSSKHMLNYYYNILGQKNFKIIPYGIKKQSYGSLNPVDETLLKSLASRYKVIGSVGLLIKRKGFKQLVELLKNNIEYAVVIIGDGNEKSNLLSLAVTYGVQDRLFLLGFKNNSIDYYKYFDLYAMTSYSEGFGLAMLEALSHGLPLVCSSLDIYSDYFSAEDVCLFTPDDESSLASAVAKCLKNRSTLSAASERLYRDNFSSEIMAINHINYYKQLVATRS